MGSLFFTASWVLAFVASPAVGQGDLKASVLHLESGQPAKRLGRTAELSLVADGLNLTLNLEADFGAFHRSYKELAVDQDGTTSTRAGAHGCHYKGTATDVVTGEGGRVTARTCGGAPEAVVRLDGGRVLELAWRPGDGAHAVFDPAEGAKARTCGVDPARHSAKKQGPRAPRRDADEHEEHTDDHGHGHGHDHDPLFHRSLGANECASGPTKYVGIVVFNDAARYAKRGVDVEAHTAAIFDVVNDIYTDAAPYGLYDGDKLNCRVVPVLVGQITWRDGNPDCATCTYSDSVTSTFTRSDGGAGVYYARGTSACAVCGDTCTSDEVSSNCLLESIGLYVDAERSELECALGAGIDAAFVLSGEDFDESTAGLAYTSGLCMRDMSVSVVEDSASVAVMASTIAHELGHLLSMSHDAGGPNIMEATGSDLEWGTALQFRTAAREEADNFFTNLYGPENPECLNNNVETSWDTPVCGDGIVDAGESCDPGLFVDDACCTNDCQLKAGCECANADACCTNGVFTVAGVECRPAQHAQCDMAETCTGLRGDCPTDLYKSPGVSCSDTIFPDDAIATKTATGKCYLGACVTQDGNCVVPSTGAAMYDDDVSMAQNEYDVADSTCVETWCCNAAGTCSSEGKQAADGTECGSGQQCKSRGYESGVDIAVELDDESDSSCVASSTLKNYHWATGADGCQTPACVDEEGAAATSADCEDAAPALPPHCSVAPTATPAPSRFCPTTPVPTTPVIIDGGGTRAIWFFSFLALAVAI